MIKLRQTKPTRFVAALINLALLFASVPALVLVNPRPALADIETLRPSAAGLYAQYTTQFPASGSHWQKVSEVTADEDSTYIQTSTAGQKDLFDVPTSGIPAGSTITNVTISARAKGLQGGANIMIGYHDGGGEYWGAGNALTNGTYLDFNLAMANNPRTGSAWTVSQINALQIGVQSNAGKNHNVTQVWAVVDYTPSTQLTVGNGASQPTNKTVKGSDTNKAVDTFTLQTNEGTATVTQLQVLGTNVANVAASGVKIWRDSGSTANEWDASDVQLGSGASFSGTTATVSSLSYDIGTTQQQFIVTYDIVASPNHGQTLTGRVTGASAGSYSLVYNDTGSATLTVDAQAPATVVNFNAADGQDSQVTLTWTNPSDSDLGEVVVRRKTGSYPTDNTDGSLVFQNLSPTPGGPETVVDGGRTNGTPYYYAVFSRDAVGNWNNTVDSTLPNINADIGTPAAQTIVGDGAAPAFSSRVVAPSATNEDVGLFTLRTGSGTDNVGTVTVTSIDTPATDASQAKIFRDDGGSANRWDVGDTLVATTTFSGANAVFSGLNLAVSTSEQQYVIAYNIAAGATNNNRLTGRVSAITAGNPVANNDTIDATLTIDSQRPTVVSATPVDPTTVDVVFSESLDEGSAEVPSRYVITGGGGLAVSDAVLQGDQKTVRLTTGTQTSAQSYTVTVSLAQPTVKDLVGNYLTTPNTANFSGFTKTVTLTGTDTISPSTIKQGLNDDFIRFTAVVNYGSTNLTGLTVNKLGTLSDAQVQAVSLYKSTDSTFDQNDTQLKTGTFSGGTISFTGLSESLSQSPLAYYFVTLQPTALASTINTLGAQIPGGGFTVSDGVATGTVVNAGPVNVVEAPDTVKVTFTNQAPRSSSRPGTGNTRLINMMKLNMSAAPKDSTVTAIRVEKLAGSTLPDGGIASVKIFASTNDQEYDAADTQLVSGSIGTTLTLFPAQLQNSAARYYFVVLEINSTAGLNQTVGVRIANEGYIGLAGADVVAPFTNYDSKLITLIGQPHGSPDNPYTASTNYCSACHRVHLAKTSQVLLEKRVTRDQDIVNGTNDPNIYNALCFSCHDGTGSTKDIKADYSDAGRTVNQKRPAGGLAVNSPGHMTDQPGTSTAVGYLPNLRYNAETKLPCLVCHDVHTSTNGNNLMMADDLYTYASSTSETTANTGASFYWDSSIGRWSSATVGAADIVRSRCDVCHRNSSTGSLSDTSVTSGSGSWVDGKSIVLGIDLGRPETHNTGTKSTAACTGCHGSHRINIDYEDAGGGGSESAGGAACDACHNNFYSAMKQTSTYQHVMNSVDAGYPTESTPTTVSTSRRCTMCHADHDVFSPTKNSFNKGNRGRNLRADIGVTPSGNDTSTFSDKDFDANAAGGNGGICVSCHKNAQTKNSAKQKDSGVTLVVDKNTYQETTLGHNYEVTSTYLGMPGETLNKPYTYRANCVKCHNTADATSSVYNDNPDLGTKQTSNGPVFQLHETETRNLLAWLNIAPTSQTASTDPLEEIFCDRCHSSASNPKFGVGQDYYGVFSMAVPSRNIKGEFSKTYNHPVGSSTTRNRHRAVEAESANWLPASNRHIECEDCHNPHAAKRGNHTQGSDAAGGPIIGATGVEATWTAGAGSIYNTGRAVFANNSNLVNQDAGSPPNWGSPVAGDGTWYIKNNYDMSGRWYKITNVTSTQLTLSANYQATYNSGTFTKSMHLTPYGVDYTVMKQPSYTFKTSATREYEVCLKCHSAYSFDAGPPASPGGGPLTAPSPSGPYETDIGLDFNPNQAAYHPVIAPGRNQPPTNANPNWVDTNQYTINDSVHGSYNGLDNTFVPPWKAASLVVCSDCHGNDTSGATAPLGPHGSSAKWILRTLDTNISYTARYALIQYSQIPSATYNTGNFCVNCHRADVYGVDKNHLPGWSGASPSWNSAAAQQSRQTHPPDRSGADAMALSGTLPSANKKVSVCMTCHGGDAMGGGIHGTNAKVGRFDRGSGTADEGASQRGFRFLNGAAWAGVTTGTTGVYVTCWTNNAADEVNSCGTNHTTKVSGQSTQYNY